MLNKKYTRIMVTVFFLIGLTAAIGNTIRGINDFGSLLFRVIGILAVGRVVFLYWRKHDD